MAFSRSQTFHIIAPHSDIAAQFQCLFGRDRQNVLLYKTLYSGVFQRSDKLSYIGLFTEITAVLHWFSIISVQKLHYTWSSLWFYCRKQQSEAEN